MTDDLDLHQLDRDFEPDPSFSAALRARLVATLTESTPPAASSAENETEPIMLLVDDDTSAPAGPRRHRRGLLLGAAAAAVAVVAIVAAIAATGDDDDLGVAGPPPALLDDGFDDNSALWTESFDTGVAVTTGGGLQTWQLPAAGQTAVERPRALRDQLLDVEVTAEVVSVSDGTSVAVLCRKGTVTPEDAAYSFRVGPAGATIALPDRDGGTLAEDSTVTVPSSPFSLGARCVDIEGVAHLDLLIDGNVVLSATDDDPLGPGVGAIEVQAGTPASEVVVDRFVVDHAG